MARAVKISDGERDVLRDAARMNSRSISGDAEHWLRIGRAIERDPTIACFRIELALRGLEPMMLDSVGEAEQDDFFERMGNAPATGAEQDFWRKRERQGLGVGLDDQDNLVFGEAVRPPGIG